MKHRTLLTAAEHSTIKKGLAIAAFILLLDQLSKWWALEALTAHPDQKIEMTSFFNLVIVWNKGISFGLFNQTGYGYIVFSFIASAIILILLVWLRKAHNPLLLASLSLIIGGAIGNIIDRIRFKAVVDFLDFHWEAWHWPAFNIADSAICVGVALLCIESLVYQDKKKEQKDETTV